MRAARSTSEPVVHGAVGVIPRGDTLLVIRRAAHIVAGGAWCFPGGAVQPGESVADALVREMREEIGLDVRPLRQLWRSRRHRGTLVLHWVLAEPARSGAFRLRLTPDEVAASRWLRPEAILALPTLLDSNRAFLLRWPALRPPARRSTPPPRR